MKRALRRSRARGYTFVELLMSMMILTIGVTGVIAMQKVTVTSNQHAKNLAMATQIAQSWLGQLQADAIAWNHPSARNPNSDLGDTHWLSNVSLMNRTWMRPAWVSSRNFGPTFDAQGKPIEPDDASQVQFCTHIRLSWLFQPGAASGAVITGNGLMRAEVRVFWLRDGMAGVEKKPVCSADVATLVGAAENRSRYHFVYATSAVRENTAL